MFTSGHGVLPAADTRALRRRELAELDSFVQRCHAGQAGIVSISGPAGSGKSSLLQAFLSLVHASGATALSATGSDRGRPIPSGVVGQLLLSAPPELLSGADESLTDDRISGLWRVLRSAASRSPVILVIDDAHLADQDSPEALVHLSRHFPGGREPSVVSHPA